MYQPELPFKDLEHYMQYKKETAWHMVSKMNEEQMRYALWSVCVILFGAPGCNATESLLAHMLVANVRVKAILEGSLILAELGVSKGFPEEVEQLRNRIKNWAWEEEKWKKKEGENN